MWVAKIMVYVHIATEVFETLHPGVSGLFCASLDSSICDITTNQERVNAKSILPKLDDLVINHFQMTSRSCLQVRQDQVHCRSLRMQ